jgi:hypothetical protein
MFSKFSLMCRASTFAAMAILLAGCSTIATAPSELKSLSPSRDLMLETPIVFKFNHGLGVKREIALLPGMYHGVGEDGKGVWYQGFPQSMSNTVLDRGGATGFPKQWIGVPKYASGGLFVPHDLRQQPLLFTIHGEVFKDAPTASRQGETGVIINTALNAQNAIPALGTSGALATGAGIGVAAGVGAVILALDRADLGKFEIYPGQPPAGTELRGQFKITTNP